LRIDRQPNAAHRSGDMKNSIKLLAIVAGVSASLSLTGCDDRDYEQAMGKLKAFINAIKPDSLLLRGLTPGVSTEAQIRD
jgi:hypothetical protein